MWNFATGTSLTLVRTADARPTFHLAEVREVPRACRPATVVRETVETRTVASMSEVILTFQALKSYSCGIKISDFSLSPTSPHLTASHLTPFPLTHYSDRRWSRGGSRVDRLARLVPVLPQAKARPRGRYDDRGWLLDLLGAFREARLAVPPRAIDVHERSRWR